MLGKRACCRGSRGARCYLDLEPRPQCLRRRLQLVIPLHVEPELRRGAEVASQAQCGTPGDPASLDDDRLDAGDRDAEVLGEPVSADPERFHKLFPKLFAGMNRRQIAHAKTSVVVDDLNLVGVALVPHETDPPPVIDANAVLTLPVTTQCLQSIARWSGQVAQFLRLMDLSQLTLGNPLYIVRQPPREPALEQRLG